MNDLAAQPDPVPSVDDHPGADEERGPDGVDWRTRRQLGNDFDDQMAADWKQTEVETNRRDRITPEKSILTPDGRRRRMDIYVEIDQSTDSVAIIENKATNWDGLSDDRIAKRVARHAAQMWKYIEAHLGAVIRPGVMVRKRPSDPDEVEATERDDRRKKIQTIWAEYDSLNPTDELWVEPTTVVRIRPGTDHEANGIVDSFRRTGVTVVWTSDLEREVYPSMNFSRRPRDRTKVDMIEALYGEYGIAVVWNDETIDDLQARKSPESAG